MIPYVLVRIGGSDTAPTLRPAVIVRAWSPSCVNAQMFPDGSNDDADLSVAPFSLPPLAARGNHVVWLTSISEGPGVGQFRHP
jgi:hypothetical protein